MILESNYFSSDIKVIGDAYAAGFSCGLSMGSSGTADALEVDCKAQDATCYKLGEKLNVTAFHKWKDEVWQVYSEVENSGNAEVELELCSSFCLNNIPIKKIYRMQSFWSAEGKLKAESITDLHLERSWNGCAWRIEKFGNVGSMPVRKYFPFLGIQTEDGGFIAVQLYLASSWQIELRCKELQEFTVSGGIADRDFGHWTKKIKPGEKFTSPKAVIAQGDTLLEACDKLVKAQKPNISSVDEDMGIVFNEYCTTWGNPSYDNVKKICDKIQGKGIKYLVIDSGWYGNAENWWDMIGDWTVNEKRFPGGMKQIAEYIRSRNMIPGLWFEMESVTSGATMFHNTPFLVKKDGVPLTVGNRRFLDMENPEAVQYLNDTMVAILSNAGFGYVKIDYNDSMGMGCDGDESMGENLRRKLLASQNFFKRLPEKIPGLVVENCSSGGHRLEPSMMELVSQASFSDAHETQAIPLIAANLHRVIKPSQSQIWAVMRAEDSKERLFYSLASTFLGRMCLSGDIYDLSEEQWTIIQEAMQLYQDTSAIIKNGKTTVLVANSNSYNNPTGNQLVVREYQDQALIVFHRFGQSCAFEEVLEDIGLPLQDWSIEKKFGKADVDFSAMVCVAKMNNV